MIERAASCEDVSLREKEWKQTRLLGGKRKGCAVLNLSLLGHMLTWGDF